MDKIKVTYLGVQSTLNDEVLILVNRVDNKSTVAYNPDTMELVGEHTRCPFCDKEVDLSLFKTDLDWKEFDISGLCKACMDDTFKLLE